MNTSQVHNLFRLPARSENKTHLAALAPGSGVAALPFWAMICLLIGLTGIWLLAHPYRGIRHDNTLYALQALHDLAPDAFEREIFLQFGAQEQYTLFTSIYATVIERFGLHHGTIILLVIGQLLWALAATLLLRNLLSGRWLWVALVVLFSASGAYGGYRIFHFAEPFVTPRLFAESLGLMALYFLIRARLLLTLLAIGGAGLLHPIMALGTAMVAFVYLTIEERGWLWLGAAGVATMLLLGFFHIQPFVRLFQIMDPSWRHMVEWRNDYLFVSKYRLTDWSYLLHTSLIVLLSAKISIGRQRRLLLASLIAAWGSLVISVVGGDWLSNVFVLQIQLWRTLWLLHVLYALAIALLIRWCWPWRDVRVVVCALLSMAWLTRNWGAVGLPLSCLLLVSVFVIQYFQIRTTSWQLRWILILLLGLSVVIVGGVMVNLSASYASSAETWQMTLLSLLAATLLPPLFVAWALHGSAAQQSLPFWMSRLSFAVLCLIAMLVWNRQSDWSRYVETASEAPAFFRQLTPPDSMVVWLGNSTNVWLGMQRSAYLNQSQGAGLVFSDQFAATYQHRLRAVAGLLGAKPLTNPRWNSAAWQLDYANFQQTYKEVCRRCTDLDYIIAPVKVPGEPIDHWRSPVPYVAKIKREHGPHIRMLYEDFYLYACARYHGQNGPTH